jgi:hypothetical protein
MGPSTQQFSSSDVIATICFKSPSVRAVPCECGKLDVPHRRGLMRTSIASDCVRRITASRPVGPERGKRGRLMREATKLEIHTRGTGRTDFLWAPHGSRLFAPSGKERETSYFLPNCILIPWPGGGEEEVQLLTSHSLAAEAIKEMFLPHSRVKFYSWRNSWGPLKVTTLLHSNSSTNPHENNTAALSRYSVKGPFSYGPIPLALIR